jgi:hypothetical protein
LARELPHLIPPLLPGRPRTWVRSFTRLLERVRHKHVTTPKARSCVPNVPASFAFAQLDRKLHYDFFHGGKSI